MEKRSNKLDRRMARVEAQCYRAAKHWQRAALRRAVARAWRPRLPFAHVLHGAGWSAKGVYLLFVVLFAPLLLLFGVLRALVIVVLFPFRYLGTYRISHQLRSPGERNIQGIHNAFATFIDLPADLYIHCVNDWVGILYGEQARKTQHIEMYMDLQRLKESRNSIGLALQGVRSAINIAREKMSQELGHY